MRALTFLLLGSLSACTCAPLGVNETRFACESNDDCLEGFECIEFECQRPLVEVPDAGDEEAFDAGIPDAGTLSLAFLTSQQSVPVGQCSAITLIEARSDGARWRVPIDTTLMLSAMPSGLEFSTSPTCDSPTNEVVINSGADNASFYMHSSTAGVFTVNVESVGFMSTTQDIAVGVTPRIITFANIPGQVRGGACTRGTIELRRGGTLEMADMAIPVSFTSMTPGAVQFFGSSTCASTATSVTIPMGATSVDFWFKPLPATMHTISATASFDADQATFASTNIVRRSGCSFNAATSLSDGGVQAGQTSRGCTLPTPVSDINSSLLFTQFVPTGSVTTPAALSMRCRLTSTTNVQCMRNNDSVAGNAYVQVAEIPQNLKVQRATSSQCPAAIPLLIDAGVEPFIIRAVSSGTGGLNGNHTAVARYVEPNVTTNPSVCGGYEHQLVEWRGVEVTSGELDGGFALGEMEATVTGLPSVSKDSVLLVQAGTTNQNELSVCSLLVRGDMPSSTSVKLTRGSGDAGCPLVALPQVTWQRIDFDERADVDTYRVTFAPNETVKMLTIAPVDVTRTIMLTSNQSFAGQGAGETDEGSSARASSGIVSFSLPGSTSLTVTRGSSGATASFVIYVVQLNP